MPRRVISRHIAADPTSTALLLAGPGAVDLWPGTRRAGESDGRVVVEAGPHAERITVTAQPPRRTPGSFISSFAWSGGVAIPDVTAELTLRYDGAHRTLVALDLEADGDLEDSGLASEAQVFLDNLAAAAEARAYAA